MCCELGDPLCTSEHNDDLVCSTDQIGAKSQKFELCPHQAVGDPCGAVKLGLNNKTQGMSTIMNQESETKKSTTELEEEEESALS